MNVVYSLIGFRSLGPYIVMVKEIIIYDFTRFFVVYMIIQFGFTMAAHFLLDLCSANETPSFFRHMISFMLTTIGIYPFAEYTGPAMPPARPPASAAHCPCPRLGVGAGPAPALVHCPRRCPRAASASGGWGGEGCKPPMNIPLDTPCRGFSEVDGVPGAFGGGFLGPLHADPHVLRTDEHWLPRREWSQEGGNRGARGGVCVIRAPLKEGLGGLGKGLS